MPQEYRIGPPKGGEACLTASWKPSEARKPCRIAGRYRRKTFFSTGLEGWQINERQGDITGRIERDAIYKDCKEHATPLEGLTLNAKRMPRFSSPPPRIFKTSLRSCLDR